MGFIENNECTNVNPFSAGKSKCDTLPQCKWHDDEFNHDPNEMNFGQLISPAECKLRLDLNQSEEQARFKWQKENPVPKFGGWMHWSARNMEIKEKEKKKRKKQQEERDKIQTQQRKEALKTMFYSTISIFFYLCWARAYNKRDWEEVKADFFNDVFHIIKYVLPLY